MVRLSSPNEWTLFWAVWLDWQVVPALLLPPRRGDCGISDRAVRGRQTLCFGNHALQVRFQPPARLGTFPRLTHLR